MPNPTHATLDRRTRRDADVVDLGPEEFFSTIAPELVEKNGHLVAAGMAALGASPLRARERSYLPIVDLPTEKGAITVHLSCTLHEARPPVTTPRKVMYGGFAQLPGKAEAAAGATELWEIRELIGGPDAPPPSRPVSAGRTHGN